MTYNNFRKLFFVPSLLAILALASCQKQVDITDPDLIPGEVKDSTLLIKSITFVYNIGLADEDSVTEYYSYDTVNRKIKLAWDDPTKIDHVAGISVELNYSTAGLLTNISYNYPSGYLPTIDDRVFVEVKYDADNVVKEFICRWGDGTVETMLFNKTKYSSGNYEINWVYNMTPIEAIEHKAIFDKDGKSIAEVVNYSHTGPTGGGYLYNSGVISDSIAYDVAGSVVNVYRNITDTGTQTNVNYILYEFGQRQTKGDQLYNQRRILMNGVADIPFEDLDDSVGDAFGSILAYSVQKGHMQFSKFPFQSLKANFSDGSEKRYIADSEFDSKERLTKFTGFVNDGIDFSPLEYRINYYK